MTRSREKPWVAERKEMRPPTPEQLEHLADRFTTAFYALMAGALFIAVFGSAGFALLLLILGAGVHVARVGVEGLIEMQPGRSLAER